MPVNVVSRFRGGWASGLLLVLTVAVVLSPLPAGAIEPVPAPNLPGDDWQENEYPARPAPGWVRMIDQGTQNPALAGIRTPAGLKVEIAAEAPLVIDPVSLNFDRLGRPHVLEWRQAPEAHHTTYEVTFRDGTKGTVNRMIKPTLDVLKRLDDTDGNGTYDRFSVLMDDLEIPSMALLHEGWVYLPSIGHVVRRRQSTPGGPFDVHEEIVRGLCGFHHHQVSGLTLGHDGWLFVTSGDDDNRGEGSDGSRATVLRTGALFRMQPDGSQLSEYARGFRNPYRDVAFDDVFNMFHVDNDNEDGSRFQGCRLLHVQEAADYGWRLLPGAVCCRPDHARGAVSGERPGKMPAMLKTGRGSPAGLLIVSSEQFPGFFRGLLIYADVYRRMVRAYELERAGSTFRVVKQFVLMESDDDLFRPCQAIHGPDGAIYIVDWRTASGGAGKLWGDSTHGRIYRLSWGGLPGTPAIPLASADRWEQLVQADDQTLLKTLGHADYELRMRALQELVSRGETHRQDFLKLMKDASLLARTRAIALGGACRLYDQAVEQTLVQLLEDENFELRRLAADGLSRHARPAEPKSVSVARLCELLEQEQHPSVQRAMALMVGRLASQLPAADSSGRTIAITCLLRQLERCDRSDAFLFDGTVRALERLGTSGLERLLVLAGSSQLNRRETAVAALEALRTRDGAAVYEKLLSSEQLLAGLSDAETARLLRAYRNFQVEPPVPVTAVVQWLENHPQADAESQVAALETIGLAGAVETAELAPIAARLMQHENEETRLRVIEAIGASGLNTVAGVLAAALAEAERSVEERREIVAALGLLRSRRLPFNNRMTPPGVESVLDELTAVAEDARQGPVRSDALSLLAQIDPAKAEPVAVRLLESDDNLAVAAAITTLGTSRERALEIGQRFVDGKIDRLLLPRVAEALRKYLAKDPGQQFARLLSQVYRGGLLDDLQADDVQRVEQLVADMGDPLRGKAVFLDRQRTQCANCHQLEGFGGKVGPDLSKVWQTHTVAKLMESMLEPSKEIKEGFATWTILTRKGQVYSGLRVSSGRRETVLRDATGRNIQLLAEEIEEQIESKQSLMPEGVIAQLSLQEFIDLVAFLKNQEAQATLREAAAGGDKERGKKSSGGGTGQ